MKLPIPSDWDGQEWQCIQVQWPKSQEYNGVLLGLLSYLTRGRLWDGRTGVIVNAQDVGWQIFNRNFPLVPCQECEECEECEDCAERGCGGQGGEAESEDEEDMSNVTWLSIEDGVLYMYFGPCCKQPVGTLADLQLGDEVADDPLNPTDDPDMVYSACGKAYAIVEMIYAVMDVVWDNSLSAPWQWVGKVEDAIPGNNDLDDNQIISAFLTADLLRGLQYTEGDVFDPNDKQQLLCAVEKLMADSSEGITRAQWDTMISQIGAIYGEVMNDFVRYCADAIGPSDMRDITKLAATDTTRDCRCPSEQADDPTEPDAQGWFLGPNLADTIQVYNGSGWSVAYALHTATEPIYGSFLVLRSINDGSDIKRMGMASAEGGFPAQTYNVSMWADSSDHLEAMNQLYPQISDVGATVQLSLAQQRGYSYFVNGGTNGVNMAVISTPEVTAGQVVGWRLDFVDTEGLVYGETFTVLELRAIHNVNHP